jgi:hypothetical protein
MNHFADNVIHLPFMLSLSKHGLRSFGVVILRQAQDERGGRLP